MDFQHEFMRHDFNNNPEVDFWAELLGKLGVPGDEMSDITSVRFDLMAAKITIANGEVTIEG